MLRSLVVRGKALPSDFATRGMVSTYVRVTERAVDRARPMRTVQLPRRRVLPVCTRRRRVSFPYASRTTICSISA